MLRKLLKYDFKSGIRVFGFLWLGILGVAGLSCLTNAIGDPESKWRIMLGIFGLFPMIIAIMGATIYPYVYGATRFYKGLLGREGYLMFTLPTTPWKLLASKLITVVCFTIVTVIVVIIGMALAVGGFVAPMVERWCEAGPTHHLALGTGDRSRELELYCRMAGIRHTKVL